MNDKPNVTPFEESSHISNQHLDDKLISTQIKYLKFDLYRMALYFGMRARFFDICGKSISILSLAAGSAAYASFIESNRFWFNIVATIMVTLASLNIVVGFSRKCRDFEVLRSKTYSVIKRIEGKPYGSINVLEITSEKLSLIAEAPPSMAALDMIAWQRTAKSLGEPIKNTPVVPLAHRLFGHVWSFSTYYIHR